MSSLIQEIGNLVTTSISIDGQAIPGSYDVLSIIINKNINKIGSAKIRLLDGGFTGLDKDFPVTNSGLFDLGKKIEIKVGYDSNEKVLFEGIIVKQGLKLSEVTHELIVECKEEAIKMTTVRNNCVYQDKKDSQIIQDLVKKHGLSVDIKATDTQHSEVVQYYCTDWDFMMLRADFNGLIAIVDGKKIILEKPALTGTPVIKIGLGEGLLSVNMEMDAKSQFKKVNCVAWDIANQKIIKSSSGQVSDVAIGTDSAKLSQALGNSEYLLQTGANSLSASLTTWSNAKLTRSKLSKIQGTVKFLGSATVLPGVLIELAGLSENFTGNAYVSGVEHVVENGNWATEASLGLSFKSYSEEMPDIVAPGASGMLAAIKGLQVAIVKKIYEDKDGQHRIQVSYPTIEMDNLGVWARLATFYATKDCGIFFIPEVNDEVIVGFVNEDPQEPIILGSLYSSKKAPPFTSEEKNNTKAIVTRSKMQIVFDEEKKSITVETPGKNVVMLDDDKKAITFTDSNKNKIEMTKDGISIDCAKDFMLKAKGKIVLDAAQDIEQKASGNIKGEGMGVEFKGKTKFAAEGAMVEVKGSGQTTIKGGIVMIN